MKTLPLTLDPNSQTRCWLVALVLISFFLISAQLTKPGQLVHIDGGEYFYFSGEIARLIQQQAFGEILATPIVAHWGAILFGTIPQLLVTQEQYTKLAAGFFFAFPIWVNILLCYRISLVLFAHQKPALLAATLYTFSFSAIYQIREVVPHDMAQMFFLLGFLSIVQHQNNKHCFLTGLFAFLCMFTYYGYWISTGLVLLAGIFYKHHNIKRLAKRTFMLMLGFVTPVMIFIGLGHLSEVDLSRQFFHFSNSIVQGEFSEGFLLPFRFYWHCEHLLALTWLSCLSISLLTWRLHPKIHWLLLGILSCYGLLVIGSNVLEKFVALGRLTKQMTPFLCILSAYFLVRIPTKFLLTLIISLVINFSVNYRSLYQSIFGGEIDYFTSQQKLQYPDSTIKEFHLCHKKPQACETIPSDCKEAIQFSTDLSQPYFQYESMKQDLRIQLRNHDYHLALAVCPP